MSTCTETAARWLTAARAEDVPTDVMAATKLRVLDVLGLILAASATPFGPAARGGALALSGAGKARILPFGDRTSPGLAALANGAMSQALQYDDTHNETIIHMSSPNVAAALALAEQHGLSGRDALVAIALGTELTCRFGVIAPGQFHKNGFHPTGIFGALGATCTTARLLKLDAATTVNALGIAGSFGSGILECWTDGTATQFLHPGWSAQAGISAAALAQAGMTGPATVLEGRFGLFASHVQDKAAPRDFERATRGLGELWESRNASFKPYPCAHIIHSFLDALLKLRAEHGLTGDQVEAIVCPVAAYMVGVMCEPAEEKLSPPNDVRARVSLQWSMAEAMQRGRLGGDAYAPESLKDPAIAALAKRVSYRIDESAPGTERYKGWVIVRTKDGRTFEKVQDSNHGSPADPMTPDEVRTKFAENAARALPKDRPARIVEAVDGLDSADGVARLIDLCVAA
jgi:2-methylcitrate dehydratase PrpD